MKFKIFLKIINQINTVIFFELSKTFLAGVSKTFLIFALIGAFFIPSELKAGDVTSTNFIIFDNGVNSGGARSTSTNFILESTLGELAGVTTSTNFSSRSGFQDINPESKMTMTLSTNSIALGTLSSGSISSASLTVTVTTNATSGYTVRLTEDGNLRSLGANNIDDVSDGAVTTGYEEYGIGTSGTAGQMNSSDAGISGTLILASSSTIATAEATTVTFKASINSATFNGSYSHTVTFITVANF